MSIQSLVSTGTKVWLDSIDPKEVAKNFSRGASGATSNPIIISDLIKTGQFDQSIADLAKQNLKDEEIAWQLTDQRVRAAQQTFLPINQKTNGDDGYVSFELDPLLEDIAAPVPLEEKKRRYIELGKKWSAGHTNRMIKVPATEGGLAALEDLAAAGITLNVTLIFSRRQYEVARDAVWRGAQKRPGGVNSLKSVYSIFISRIDVYTEKHVPTLSPSAQGMVGILNSKEIWKLNQDFWKSKNLPLHQELIFASTGTKKPSDPADKYVRALAGSDIQTNPPATNEAVESNPTPYTRTVDQFPPQPVIDEIHQKLDQAHMEKTLMDEGTKKFADPQHALLKLIADKRAALSK
ncbi:MAG TPA: transaldolase family protein [Tepidisphaeraceae bacterium]|jgi:transaldolase|nr:transaldolase family protein [Tepidisphaeraceae bacterium]